MDSSDDDIYYDAESPSFESYVTDHLKPQECGNQNTLNQRGALDHLNPTHYTHFLFDKIKTLNQTIEKTQDQMTFLQKFLEKNPHTFEDLKFPGERVESEQHALDRRLLNLTQQSSLQQSRLRKSSTQLPPQIHRWIFSKKSFSFMFVIIFFFVLWPLLAYRIWQIIFRNGQRKLLGALLKLLRRWIPVSK